MLSFMRASSITAADAWINVKKGEDSAQNAQRRSAVVDFLITGEYFLGRLPGSFSLKKDVKIL
jgi:hypothetical protein